MIVNYATYFILFSPCAKLSPLSGMEEEMNQKSYLQLFHELEL